MKSTPSFILLFIILMGCSALVTCTQNEDTPIVTTDERDENFFEKPMLFTSGGGKQALIFTTNVDWSLSISSTDGDYSWCSVSKSGGNAGRQSIQVTVERNYEYEDRELVIVLTAGIITKNVVVRQEQNRIISLSNNLFKVGHEGGTVIVEITTNVDFDIVIPSDCDWVSDVNTKALSSRSLSFHVARNECYDPRSVDIQFNGVNGDISEIITIEQSAPLIIIPSQSLFRVDGQGGIITVDILANIEYDVILPSNCTWVSKLETRIASSQSLSFYVAPNENYDSRSVDILFKEINGDISETITIEQSALPVIKPSQDFLKIDGEGGTITVNITANIGYDIIIPMDCDWIYYVVTRSVSNDAISFSIANNDNYDARSAIISLEGKNGVVSTSITIEQSGTTIILPNQDSFTVGSEGAIISLEIQSNCAFDIIMPEVEWIRIVSDSRDGFNNKLVLEVLKNDGFSSRNAHIVFIDTHKLKSVTVEIVQEQNNMLVVQNNHIQLSADGGKTKIYVETNISFSVQILSTCSWIHFDSIIQSGAFQRIISLVVDANESYDSRNTKLSIIGDYNIKEDITIAQEGKEVKFNVYLSTLKVTTASPSVHIGNGLRFVHKYISAKASFYPANSDAEVYFQTNVLGKVNCTSKTESSFEVKNCRYDYYATVDNPVILEIRAAVSFRGKTFYSEWRSYKMSSW